MMGELSLLAVGSCYGHRRGSMRLIKFRLAEAEIVSIFPNRAATIVTVSPTGFIRETRFIFRRKSYGSGRADEHGRARYCLAVALT